MDLHRSSPSEESEGSSSLSWSRSYSQEWRRFAKHWDVKPLLYSIADVIPDLVLVIWDSEYLRLADVDGPGDLEPLCRTCRRLLASRQNVEAHCSTRRLLHSILNRTTVSAAALLLALYLVYRYRVLPNSVIGGDGSQYKMFLVATLLAIDTRSRMSATQEYCPLAASSASARRT